MWENPIEIIQTDIQYKVVDEYEKQILKAIQSYGISVNKKEPVKALNYDRNQYEKGYADAKAEQCWIPCSERLPEEFEPVLGTFKFQGGNVCLTTERIVVNGEERWSAACGMTPIAWQPLPEPYKAEE